MADPIYENLTNWMTSSLRSRYPSRSSASVRIWSHISEDHLSIRSWNGDLWSGHSFHYRWLRSSGLIHCTDLYSSTGSDHSSHFIFRSTVHDHPNQSRFDRVAENKIWDLKKTNHHSTIPGQHIKRSIIEARSIISETIIEHRAYIWSGLSDPPDITVAWSIDELFWSIDPIDRLYFAWSICIVIRSD